MTYVHCNIDYYYYSPLRRWFNFHNNHEAINTYNDFLYQIYRVVAKATDNRQYKLEFNQKYSSFMNVAISMLFNIQNIQHSQHNI